MKRVHLHVSLRTDDEQRDLILEVDAVLPDNWMAAAMLRSLNTMLADHQEAQEADAKLAADRDQLRQAVEGS